MRLPSLVAVATSVCLLAGAAWGSPSDHGQQKGESGLRSRLSVNQAESLMASDVLADRVRALERLGATRTPRAIERLIRALDPGGGAATAEERLTAVRELAARVDEGGVRRALARVLGGHAASAEQRGPLDDLAQSAAALALARSGATDALVALGKALSGRGVAAQAATEALVAYPPRELGPVLEGAPIATPELAAALAELGDQRAFEPLRSLVRGGSPEVRARAAIALTELGDYETVPLALLWIKAGAPDELRIAAAHILALAHAPQSADAIRALFAVRETWRAGLAMALVSPSPSFSPSLSSALPDADDETLPSLLSALGRCGGPAALTALEAELRDYRGRALAADALAHMPGEGARRVLERGLARRDSRRLSALALGVRRLVGLSVPASLAATFEVLTKSAERDDRAAGALGLAILDPNRVEPAMRSTDVRVVASVAPLLPLASNAAVETAASLLPRAADAGLRAALALSLFEERTENRVPTETLLALVDDKTTAAPLAARALLARDDARTRPTTDSLLASDDPVMRFHAALGLGRSDNPDAVGRLAAAYRFESNPEVRRAIVISLSHHDPKATVRALRLASTLDPDRETRSAARLALGGVRIGLTTRGDEAAVFSAAEGPAPPRPMAVKTPSGMLLPVVSGPEGYFIMAGLPRGSTLAVAPAGERGKDPSRGASGDQKDDRINGTE